MIAYDGHVSSMPRSEFSNVEMHAALRALRFGQKIVHLPPKAYNVLEYLFEHRDRIVPKSELLSELWPPGRSEHTLRQEIYALRRILTNHGVGECVATISHYGYRFQIETLEKAVEPAGPALNDFHHRALAATAHFRRRADTQGWMRALFWYERLCAGEGALPSMHVGAVRAVLHLALRSAISRDEAAHIVRRHLSALSSAGEIEAETYALATLSEAFFSERRPQASTASRAPRDFELLWSYLHLAMGDIDRALSYSAASLQREPQDLEMHLHRGFMVLLSGAHDVAASHFRFILQLQPENTDALEHLSLSHLAASKAKDAFEIARKLDTARGLALRCASASMLGDTGEAEKAFTMLEAQARCNFVSGMLLARCHLHLKRPNEARLSCAKGSKELAARWADLENPLWRLPSQKENVI